MPLAMVDKRLVRSTSIFAGVAAAIIGILIPAFFFTFGYRYNVGHLDAQARFLSGQISQIVGKNPQFWQFETNRIVDLIGATDDETHLEQVGWVFNLSGLEVTSYPRIAPELDWPVIRTETPIYDFGVPRAELVLERSLNQLLMRTFGVAGLATIFACWFYLAMRLIPLRALEKAVQKVAFMANHDELTQLPNRRRFNERLSGVLEDARHGRYRHLAVMIVDLDRFKEVNDTLGHHAGDTLLLQAAERIVESVDNTCMLARLSGDEFAIIQTHRNQPTASHAVSQKIVDAMAKPFVLDGAEFSIGASVGIAHYPQNGRTATAMLLNADAALYRAKQDGRSRYCFFDEDMQAKSLERRAMKRDLQTALAEGQFELHYQPQVDLRNHKVVGVEALLRWFHPRRGSVSPADFIPLAEESGIIIPLGEFVLRQACSDAIRFGDLVMAVNVSPIQFRQADLAHRLEMILKETGLAPERLQIEITEGILLQDTESTLRTLKQIKDLGVHVAMDDFGTGYSSLSYLRLFAFDKIKIDRSFVNELGFAEDADAIVRAAINLGQSLGIRTNAEGAETADQTDWLTRMGCEEVQGYHFGRPVRMDELQATIDRIESIPPAPAVPAMDLKAS